MSRKREEVQVFNFNDRSIGVVEQNGEPWFIAKDVCRVLEIKNTRDAVKGLDSEEKGIVCSYTPGGNQKTIIVSKSGLFYLVDRSKKKPAREFQKWLRKEVLPYLGILDKNGLSTKVPSVIDVLQAQVKILASHEGRLDSHRSKLDRHDRELSEVKNQLKDLFESSEDRAHEKKDAMPN